MTTERAPATARKGLALVLLALPSLTSSFLHSSPSSSWTARPSPALRQQQQQQPASGVRGAGGRTGVVADAAKQQQAKKEKKGAEPAEEIPLEDVMADVEKVRAAAVAEIDGAADEKALNDVRVKYLGKKGSVQAFMAMMRSLSNADKPKLGAVVSRHAVNARNRSGD